MIRHRKPIQNQYMPERHFNRSVDNFHDRDKSPDWFKPTRVNTCNNVQIQNGKAYAVPFGRMTTSQIARKEEKLNVSMDLNTSYRSTHNRREPLNSGSYYKPLTKYNPNAPRNRLPNLDSKMISPYYDQIEIGDRFKNTVGKTNPWVSEYNNKIGKHVETGCCTHPLTIARMNKTHRDKQTNP